MDAQSRRDVVVIGGSAGSHDAIRQLVAGLPAGLRASVLVTLHLAPTGPSTLAGILARAGRLPASAAVDGKPAAPGCIYTAVPDRHLLITDDDILRNSRGPRQNRVRPAVDALFRAAARWCGPRVIGVVLSGALDDGAVGLADIARYGGIALVQQPSDARFDGMPAAALRAVPDAAALPAAQLGPAIADLAGQPVTASPNPPDDSLRWETDMLADGQTAINPPGPPVPLGCPECAGGMFRLGTGGRTYYACHTGHAYSPQNLLAARDDNVEAALWTAISALQEKAMVLRQLAEHAAQRGDRSEHRYRRLATEQAEHAAEVLRRQLTEQPELLEAAGDDEAVRM